MHGWTDPIDQGGTPERPESPADRRNDRSAEPPTAEPWQYDDDATGRPGAPNDPLGYWHGDGTDPWAATREDQPPVAAGRHRRPRRWPVPIGLAAVVAVLLLMLGIGAALLPPSFSGSDDSGSPAPAGVADDLTRPAAGGGTQDLLGAGPPGATSPNPETASPSPSTSSTPSATPSPSPSPAKARTASPKPSRAPNRSASSAPAPAGDSREEQVLSLVNQERAAAGCGALKINSQLATAARLHSQDQADTNNMSHTGSDGSSPSERARRAGYSGGGIGENVAFGYPTPAAVMEGWMNSAGHRANILNCDYKVIGIGVAAADNDRLYWTQMFGTAG